MSEVDLDNLTNDQMKKLLAKLLASSQEGKTKKVVKQVTSIEVDEEEPEQVESKGKYSEKDLNSMKVTDLKSILGQLGRPYSNRNKVQLVEDILKYQGAEPVKTTRRAASRSPSPSPRAKSPSRDEATADMNKNDKQRYIKYDELPKRKNMVGQEDLETIAKSYGITKYRDLNKPSLIKAIMQAEDEGRTQKAASVKKPPSSPRAKVVVEEEKVAKRPPSSPRAKVVVEEEKVAKRPPSSPRAKVVVEEEKVAKRPKPVIKLIEDEEEEIIPRKPASARKVVEKSKPVVTPISTEKESQSISPYQGPDDCGDQKYEELVSRNLQDLNDILKTYDIPEQDNKFTAADLICAAQKPCSDDYKCGDNEVCDISYKTPICINKSLAAEKPSWFTYKNHTIVGSKNALKTLRTKLGEKAVGSSAAEKMLQELPADFRSRVQYDDKRLTREHANMILSGYKERSKYESARQNYKPPKLAEGTAIEEEMTRVIEESGAETEMEIPEIVTEPLPKIKISTKKPQVEEKEEEDVNKLSQKVEALKITEQEDIKSEDIENILEQVVSTGQPSRKLTDVQNTILKCLGLTSA